LIILTTQPSHVVVDAQMMIMNSLCTFAQGVNDSTRIISVHDMVQSRGLGHGHWDASVMVSRNWFVRYAQNVI